MQEHTLFSTSEQYYFSRVKDTHMENGKSFITLFARLSVNCSGHSQYVWADLDEIAWDQASQKLQIAPDGVYTYQVSAGVFQELQRLSQDEPAGLYMLTPLYRSVKFKRLAQHNKTGL